MNFVEQLQALAIKTEKLCPVLETEEATKNALVLPLEDNNRKPLALACTSITSKSTSASSTKAASRSACRS